MYIENSNCNKQPGNLEISAHPDYTWQSPKIPVCLAQRAQSSFFTYLTSLHLSICLAQPPTMSRTTTNLSPAFKLVRDLLAEQPRTFQELLRAGVAAVPSATPTSTFASASSSSTGEINASTSGVNVKGKGKASAARKVQKAELSRMPGIVPEGHPFVSAK
jgi:hypothetical protein